MISPRRGVVLNLSPTHFVIKLILTSKVEPPPKRLLNLRGNFLRTGGVQEQGAQLLTCGKRGHMGRDYHAPTQNGMGKEDSHVVCALHAQKHISRNWIFESGASNHMAGEKDWHLPRTQVSASGCITLVNGRKTCVKGKRSIVATSGEHKITLTNLLHVLGLHFNLLSASRLVQDTSLHLIMQQDGTYVFKQENQTIKLRTEKGGIYSLVSKAELWHARLGHVNVHTFRQLGLPSEKKYVRHVSSTSYAKDGTNYRTGHETA